MLLRTALLSLILRGNCRVLTSLVNCISFNAQLVR